MSSNIIKAPLCYHPPTLLYKLWYYLILCHWSPRSGIHWWHSVFSSSKVLNSPHSFYFSSTLEGVKQPVCAPPLLGWNPALLQRCVSVCVCPHAFDGRARSSLWKPAGCSSDEKAHKRLPRRSHATQTVQSDLRVSESGDMEETDEGNTFAGVGEREWWELMGADGNGATVAELRLIAALDKESIW